MRKNELISNYPFIVGLLILFINDHFFKSEFGNWYTGKISDFTGIFILPFFISYIFKTKTKISIVITFFFFLLWKTEYSDVFIDKVNSLSPIKFNRTVDYSDYIAFLSLFLSYYIMININSFTFKKNTFIKYSTLFFTFATLTSTSVDDESIIENIVCEEIYKEIQIGNGKVFIPNLFTPDDDGKNDIFQIETDLEIIKIDTFLITKINKNIIDTVFYKINILDINPENGFKGEKLDTIISKYNYEITVTSGDIKNGKIFGTVTSLKCNTETNIEEFLKDNYIDLNLECALASLYNFETGIDKDIDINQEVKCE